MEPWSTTIIAGASGDGGGEDSTIVAWPGRSGGARRACGRPQREEWGGVGRGRLRLCAKAGGGDMATGKAWGVGGGGRRRGDGSAG